jgi:hypothetical protein
MSRHRNVRNLNIAGKTISSSLRLLNYWIDINTDELDDDALSDGGDEELTPEQQGSNEIALLAYFMLNTLKLK